MSPVSLNKKIAVILRPVFGRRILGGIQGVILKAEGLKNPGQSSLKKKAKTDSSLTLRVTSKNCHPEAVSSPKDPGWVLGPWNRILHSVQNDNQNDEQVLQA